MTEEANPGGSDSQQPNGSDPASGSDNKQHMIKRLVGQRDKARDEAKTSEEIAREALERSNKLQRELDLLRNSNGGGNPEPSGGGSNDDGGGNNGGGDSPDISKIIKSEFEKRDQQARTEQERQAFGQKVDAHYKRAEKLGVADYEQAEANALNVLGADIVEALTNEIPNSEKLLYMLGSEKGEAERLAQLFRTNPRAATIETGRLSVKADNYEKITAADPEDGLNPGGAPEGGLAVLEKQLDKAYDEAAKDGDLSKVKEIKKKIKALKAG